MFVVGLSSYRDCFGRSSGENVSRPVDRDDLATTRVGDERLKARPEVRADLEVRGSPTSIPTHVSARYRVTARWAGAEDGSGSVAPVLNVIAESAYPVVTPGARVRVEGFSPFLRSEGIDLRFLSHISSDEYRVLGSPGERVRKARVIVTAAARVARRSRPPDALLMVHRLLSLVPVPGHDPPPRIDVYDFDDALFQGSISAENRRYGMLKREPERHHVHLRRARLVLAGNDYLAAHARQHARRVEVVPSCIDASAYVPRTHVEREIITVGWIGSARRRNICRTSCRSCARSTPRACA